MDVGVLVSGCGCSLIPRTSFHFEVRMELGTGLKTSVGVGIDVCTCVGVCACVRAVCVRACVRCVCVCACGVCACVRACVRAHAWCVCAPDSFVSVYMTEKTTPTSSGHRYDLLHWSSVCICSN